MPQFDRNLLFTLAAIGVLLCVCSFTAYAGPITIQNVRFASQDASANIVPIAANGTTSYTQIGGEVFIFFDTFGTEQGMILANFAGNLQLAQGSVPYFGTGQEGNPSPIGINTFVPFGTFTGTVTFTLADGSPLFYLASDGTTRTNPVFSIQITSVPAPQPTPEPTTIVLLMTSFGLFRLARRRRGRQT